MGSVLNKVLALQPTTYNYKRNKKSDPATIGLIAQEVQDHFPDLVSQSNDILGVSYSKLGVIAVKAIQEQQKLIEKQNNRLQKQDQLIEQLIDKINAMENSKL